MWPPMKTSVEVETSRLKILVVIDEFNPERCCLCVDNVDEDLLRNLTAEFSADF